MIEKDDKKQAKAWLIFAPILLFQLCAFGFLGFLFDSSHRSSGFVWGIGVGLAILILSAVGYLGWEWIKKGADKGKLLPYLLVGFLAAIAISGLLAVNLGNPGCDEQGDAPYSSCVTYTNDGFEANSSQQWHKFWSTLPATVIIAALVAIIVRNEMHKRKK